MYKKWSCLIVLVFPILSSVVWAQNTATLHGRITDSVSQEPIPYATVQLLDAAGTLINGAITDAGGKFTMKEVPYGTQTFIVSFVGYRAKRIVKEIKEKEQWISIGIVVENKQLHEVSIVGEKVLMKEEVDKTVYRLDDFVLRNSPTVLEAMKTIPGVTVKTADESIRVNGSKNVLVLVDGMYSSRSLTTLNPEDVESVEVITNPSVEYDSGVANVVNIILKEERKQGVRVVAMGRGAVPFNHFYGRLNVDYEFSKFRVFGNYMASYYRPRPEGFVYDSTYCTVTDDEGNLYDELTTTTILSSPPSINHKAGFGFDWRISKNDLLSLSGNFELDSDKVNSCQYSLYNINGGLGFEEWNDITSQGRAREQNYTLYYRHRFAQKGHEITFNSNYYTMKGTREYRSNSLFHYPDADSVSKVLERLTDNGQSAWNVKLKYDLPLTERLKLTMGLQNYSRYINYVYSIGAGGQYFDYHDNRLAAFMQVACQFSDRFSVSAGLRGENLRFHLYDTLSRSQWNALPSATMMYKINENNTLKINYKSLLQYPSYHFLAPFVYTQNDALVYSAGNPYLLPEKTQRVSVGYAFHQQYTNLIVEPYVAYRQGIIGERYQVAGAVTNTIYDNLASSWKYGGRISATTLVGGFLMPMVEFDMGYVNYGQPQYNGLEMSFVAALEMELPWDLTLEAEFVYDGRKHLYNGYEYGSPLIETLALSRSFLHDKLIVELDMQGFFLSEKTEEMVDVPGYYSLNRAEQRMPSVSLFARYVFRGGDRKMEEIEERESLMESESNATQRK
jgi:outer membrane receptor for ferrienterochelin and colicin